MANHLPRRLELSVKSLHPKNTWKEKVKKVSKIILSREMKDTGWLLFSLKKKGKTEKEKKIQILKD